MSFEINPEFKTIECQEFCIRVADGTHDSPKETKIGKKLVTSKNVKGGRLELESAYLISAEDFDSINKRSKVDQWDLLLTMIGTVGEVCLVAEQKPNFAIKNVGLLKCGDELRAKWLYYFLSSVQGQTLVEQRKKGSTQQYISLTELRKLPISYPEDKRVMRSIIESLVVLDDRITLLGETNQTLEAIAQALFKSWFVDFDPVRAKADGKLPEGIDAATAALFPDAFEESELGMVPKGWAVEPLDKVASFLNGLALQKFPPTGQGDLPVIKIAQLRKGDAIGADMAAGSIKSEYIIKNGDVLFSWSGSLEVDIWCGGDGALNQHLFKVTSSRFQKWFYYFWTKHHLVSFRQIAASKATTMGHIQRSHLTQAKVVVPSEKILATANEPFVPLVDRIVENTLQANTLSNLRDTLLPRLISGQLRIADAETELEKATA